MLRYGGGIVEVWKYVTPMDWSQHLQFLHLHQYRTGQGAAAPMRHYVPGLNQVIIPVQGWGTRTRYSSTEFLVLVLMSSKVIVLILVLVLVDKYSGTRTSTDILWYIQCMKRPVAHSLNSTWFWIELPENCCEPLKFIMKYISIQFCERPGHGRPFHALVHMRCKGEKHHTCTCEINSMTYHKGKVPNWFILL